MRYFIHLSYDGTRYNGWQIQPNAVTVQGELERGLSLILRRDVSIVGAGRTDTGVHARHMAAHFDVSEPIDHQQVGYRLNRIMPPDIAVHRIEPVSDDMHARFSAKARTYHYYIHTHKSPFLRSYSLETHYDLDFRLMNEAAAHLLSVSDFAAFCKAGSDVKTTVCRVTTAQWVEQRPGEWYFEITADRFLRNMVRAIVGTLLDVGRGVLTIQQFREIIEKKDRCSAGMSVPGNALFLADVTYPDDIFIEHE